MKSGVWLVVLGFLLLPGGYSREVNTPEVATEPLIRLTVSEGLASFYGHAFDGRQTASGFRFDMDSFVAAHPTYPFGTILRVTNLRNGRSVRVHVVDRGPAAGPRSAGVIIDLSERAARVLNFIEDGRTRVRLDVLRWGAGAEMR